MNIGTLCLYSVCPVIGLLYHLVQWMSLLCNTTIEIANGTTVSATIAANERKKSADDTTAPTTCIIRSTASPPEM